MNTREYCIQAEQKESLHKQLYPDFPIKEDNSPLISLKESGFNLRFERSIIKDYQYSVREAVFEKIGRISKCLDQQDKRLIIRSAWRSFEHQRLSWKKKVVFMKKNHPEKSLEEIKKIVSYYIAPETASMHATGGAVDALIYDLKNGIVLDFGTNNGLKMDLNERCYPFHPDISTEAKKNRKLLIELFENEDFCVDVIEYWHFNYGNASWAIEKGRDSAIYGMIKDHT